MHPNLLQNDKYNFTEAELDEHETFLNLWIINDYIEIFGHTGWTNYTPMVNVHLPFYMRVNKKLGRCSSNQRWKRLNAHVQTYFCYYTNKGGGEGKVKLY